MISIFRSLPLADCSEGMLSFASEGNTVIAVHGANPPGKITNLGTGPENRLELAFNTKTE